MQATLKALEQKLLRDGTAAGPVTQEMIDFCKARYEELAPGEKWGWTDLLPVAREKFKQSTQCAQFRPLSK